ncbi:DUF6906 family protein [Candidatus Contubernalis alkaliaceticus]|uniref:DUF6906 family protein n=1 Tax=Candidatus Contubernalis alkaliaceticus TaxID=338645 RepID=UPI001F4C20BF|nr:hypothetical protein [Candidatus Contubernalis alkalaceticus]UNC91665.1 hypothetical protein HUE98_05900 [Candidatus Contubernalis alkalaceticus]
MKNGKKLHRSMIDVLEKEGLDPADWLYVKNEMNKLTLAHRETGQKKTIYRKLARG